MDTDHRSDHTPTEVVDGVFLSQLAAGERMSIQHVHVEPGAEVPEHSHEHEQLGFIYQGALTFLVDGEEIVCDAGDSYALASEEPHGAVNNGETAVKAIDIFSPPRLDVPWMED
ncbi:MAG: cupin domain-containing protein [Halobacteriales archaeon]